MAEELVMNIKSNIKGVTKDTEDLNNTLSEQKKILLELQKEEMALQQKRANMTAYEKSLSGIDKKLEHINLSIKDQKLAVKGLTDEQKEAVKEQKEYNKASKETIADFSVMGVSLNSVKKGFSQIIPTAKALFGTIRAGIMSTGIGALVLAVVALTQSFKRSEAGQEKFQRIMAAIGAVTSQVMDAFSDLGGIIIDTFQDPLPAMTKFGKGLLKFLKDPTGATRDMFVKATLAAKGFVDETLNEVDALVEVTNMRQKAHHIDRKLKVERAKANREINDIRLKAEDREKFNATERIALLRKAQAIEENITAKEIRSKQLLVDALKLEIKQNQNNIEIKDSLAQLQAELINLDTKKLRSQRLLQTQITTAVNQEKALKEAAREKELEDDFNFYSQLSANIKKKKAEDEKAAEDEIKLNKLVKDTKKQQAMQGLALITQIAGEGSKIGKAAAVTSATISGVEGVQNAFTTATKSPITTVMPAYPFIQAGLAGAFSAIQIQKILSGSPAGGGGGGGVSAPATPATPAPQMMSGAFDLSGGLEPEPTRAYVVTDEMTNSQNQLANIRRRATI